MREFGTRTPGHGVAWRCARPRNGIKHTTHASWLGGKSLQCAGASLTPLLVMPRQWVIPCILHCTIAIGRLQHNFIRRELEGLSTTGKIRLEGHLGDHETRRPDR